MRWVAHRSQYGFRARVAQKTGEISYGFAKHLREALPNASFIGFTGTPIEQEDVNTPAVFGNYIDVYDINRGVEDGATVPIYYESRLARIELDEDEKPALDDEIAELTEDEAEGEQELLKRRWANVEAVVGAEKRLRRVARDLVEHFESRIVIARHGEMELAQARRRARDMLAHIRAGGNPAEDIRREKETPTFREFADEYLRRCEPRWKPSGRKTVRIYLKARILPTFGKTPLDRIGPEDMAAWLDAASRDKPGAANRAFEILRAMTGDATTPIHPIP